MIKRGNIYLLLFLILIVLGLIIIQLTGFASEGMTSSSVSIDGLRIIYTTFNGTTTDFNSMNNSELENLSSMILEKTAYGKIEFNETVNLTLTGGENRIVNFDVDLILSQNLVSIDSIELPYLNKSVTITLKGLSFTTPQIMKGDEVCSSCNLISYVGGQIIFTDGVFSNAYYIRELPILPSCGDGICNGDETCSTCAADCGICDDGGGGGGGGGGVVTPDIITSTYSYYLVPSFFASELKKGSYYQKEIIIVNNGTKDIMLGIGVADIELFVFPEVNNISIGAGQNASLRLNIYVSDYREAEVYIGNILFRGAYVQPKNVTVVLDVKDRNALFDIRAEVLKRYINPGGRVRANISIINMGDLRNFDVSLLYKAIDYNNVEYVIKKEDFAMNQTFQGIFFFDLPEDIPIGSYLFYARVSTVDNISASSYDTFTVEKVSFWAWILLIVAILIVIGVILVNLAKQKGWWWFAGTKKEKDKKDKKTIDVKEGPSLIDIARSKGI